MNRKFQMLAEASFKGEIYGTLPECRLDADAMQLAARNEGCLLLRNVIDPEIVLNARRYIIDLMSGFGWLEDTDHFTAAIPKPNFKLEGPSDPVYVEFLQHLLPRPEFAALREMPTLWEVVDQLSDSRLQHIGADVCRVVLPGTNPTFPHQDSHYLRDHTELWTAWMPLGDCPISLGPIALLPGSHHRGLLPHRSDNESPESAVTIHQDGWSSASLNCGDIILFSGYTLHRSMPNRTDSLRLSADFRFAALMN